MSANKNIVINKETIEASGSPPKADKKASTFGVVPFHGHPGASGGQSPQPISTRGAFNLVQGSLPMQEVPVHGAPVSQQSAKRPPLSINHAGYQSVSQADPADLGQISDVPVTRLSALERLPQDNSRWLWIAIIVLCSVVTLFVTRLWYEQKLHKSDENVAKIKAELTEKSSALKQAQKTVSATRPAPLAAKMSGSKAASNAEADLKTTLALHARGADPLALAAQAAEAKSEAGATSLGTPLPILFEEIKIRQENSGKMVRVAFNIRNKGVGTQEIYVFVLLKYEGGDAQPIYVGYPEKLVATENGPPSNLTKGMKVRLAYFIEKYAQVPIPAEAAGGHLQAVMLIAIDAKGHSIQEIKTP